MNHKADLSIIIVSFNTREVTAKCLDLVREFAPKAPYEVIVVDNASHDGSPDMLEKEYPWVRLIRLEKNLGFAGGNNAGIREAAGRYILLLNSDAFIAEGVLDSTLAYMEQNPHTGVLGCKLTNPDGSLQASARMLPSPLNKLLVITGLTARFPKSRFFGRVDFSWWDHSQPRKAGWVVGAYFLIRREVIDAVGMLDERYFLYSEEIDFCMAAHKAGWDVVFFPHAQVVHLGGQSARHASAQISESGAQLIEHRIRSEFRYYRKWHGAGGVILSASTELFWRTAVYLKNLLSGSDRARSKRRESLLVSELIVRTLIQDRLGRGNG